MKKLLTLVVAVLIICISATACNKPTNTTSASSSSSSSQTSSREQATSNTQSTTSSSNSVSQNATSSVSTASTSSATSSTSSSTTSSASQTPASSVVIPANGTTFSANDTTIGTYTAETVIGNYTICAGAVKDVAVDANAKTCGSITFTKRVKLGTFDAGSKQRSIAFTVKGSATITYCAMSSSGTELNRKISIYNQSGVAVATSTTGAQANGNELIPSELSVSSAGTYYIGSADGGVNFYFISIDSTLIDVAPVTPTIPTGGQSLNASSVTVATLTAETPCGTYFTLIAGAGVDSTSNEQNETIVIDANAKTSGTLSFTNRIKLGGVMNTTNKTRSIKFTTTGPATITYCAMSSSGSATDRTVSIIDESGATVATSTAGAQAKGNEITPRVLNVTSAGTYYIGSLVGGVNFYYVNVAE